jgi:protocatechuate 3,4-dioxygenase beta subunit
MLQALGLGAVVAGAAACGASTTSASPSSTAAAGGITEIPDETGGPFPGDGTNGVNVLTESGIVRSDIRSSFGTSTTTAAGVPLTFQLLVTDMANGNKPFAGAAVYVWHCDREGRYSLYSDTVTNENYLRGVQIADSSGKVEFTTVFPGCYQGRWPHIHFEVYPDQPSIASHDNCVSTSQLAIPQAASEAVYATTGYQASVSNLAELTLATDSVFRNDGGVHQLATVSGDVTAGYVASLAVPVDTRTRPSR